MNYKVLLYKDKKALPGEPPGDWPAYVNEVKDDEVVESPWLVMSEEAYHAYRLKLRPTYDEWDRTFNTPKHEKISKIQEQSAKMKKEMRVYDDYESVGLKVPANILEMRANCDLLDEQVKKLELLNVGDPI